MEEYFYKTPIKRAYHLLGTYNQNDKKYNRGQGDLTPEWIVENIFTKPCAHCGTTGWNVIGCNRLDNSKPHTMDNVEPCCYNCNKKLADKSKAKQVYQYSLNGELITIWESSMDIQRELGYSNGNISACCNGQRKTYKGYVWKHNP